MLEIAINTLLLLANCLIPFLFGLFKYNKWYYLTRIQRIQKTHIKKTI